MVDYWRSTENAYAYVHADVGVQSFNRFAHKCDRSAGSPMAGQSILSNASWYHFSGEAGEQMPTEPPAYESCGTTSPGWLASAHPRAGEPPRWGMVCFREPPPNDARICKQNLEVRVCACSYDAGVVTNYFYRLPEPPACDMAFCGTMSDGPFSS